MWGDEEWITVSGRRRVDYVNFMNLDNLDTGSCEFLKQRSALDTTCVKNESSIIRTRIGQNNDDNKISFSSRASKSRQRAFVEVTLQPALGLASDASLNTS